jgi:hypothetical protein
MRAPVVEEKLDGSEGFLITIRPAAAHTFEDKATKQMELKAP